MVLIILVNSLSYYDKLRSFYPEELSTLYTLVCKQVVKHISFEPHQQTETRLILKLQTSQRKCVSLKQTVLVLQTNI